MTEMTSSAASDTDNARNLMSGYSGRIRRSTSEPPPSGMCTSSSTTCGLVRAIPATASRTEPASPTTRTLSEKFSSSVRAPVRNSPWSSTKNTVTGSRAWVIPFASPPCPRRRGGDSTRLVQPGGRGGHVAAPHPGDPSSCLLPHRHLQPHLGAFADGRAHLAASPVAGHPAADGIGKAVPVRRDGVRVESLAPVAHEHRHLARFHLGVDADLLHPGMLGGVDHGLPGRLHHGDDRLAELDVAHRDVLHRDG